MTKAELEVLNNLTKTIETLNAKVLDLNSQSQKEKNINRILTTQLEEIKNRKDTEYEALPIETKLLKVATQALVKTISQDNWAYVDYKNKFVVPNSFLVDVYNSIDTSKLKVELKENIEKALAKKVFDSFFNSTDNDIRNALNIPYIRDDMKMSIKTHIQNLIESMK
jgi:hypothetical protein